MAASADAQTRTNYLEEDEQVFTMPAPPPSGAYVMVPPLRPLRASDLDELADDHEPTLVDLPRISQLADLDETMPPAADTDPAPPPHDFDD